MREDAYYIASICGFSIAHIRTCRDKLSGEFKLESDIVDPTRFYPDPSATRLNKCRFVVYEPELDLSTIKEYWPDKAQFIKPGKSMPINSSSITSTRSRSDDELVMAPGNEFSIGADNKLRKRTADVAFIWIKDDTVSEDVLTEIVRAEQTVLECSDCGLRTQPMGEAACPNCGSDQMSQVVVPGEARTSTVMSRPYPFGRLIIICQDVLFYDGPNDLELDEVFPFEIYTHYRIPTRFQGYGDVALLKSNQMQADKNMAQLIDAMRLTLNGFLQVPANEPAWQHVTNEPGQKVPTRIENANIARWITPQGYNANLHSMADNMIYQDFQRISGEFDTSISNVPSAPDSAAEVKTRDSTRGQRIGRHLKRFNQFSSRYATKWYQAMNQLYIGPRPFTIQSADRTFQAIELDVSQLPKGLAIRVEADLDSQERDRNVGQNLTLFLEKGGMDSPYAPLFLRLVGANEAEIREIMQLKQQAGPTPPPQPPPPAADKVLIAISDILKVQPSYVGFAQVQQALTMAGIQPMIVPDPGGMDSALIQAKADAAAKPKAGESK